MNSREMAPTSQLSIPILQLLARLAPRLQRPDTLLVEPFLFFSEALNLLLQVCTSNRWLTRPTTQLYTTARS